MVTPIVIFLPHDHDDEDMPDEAGQVLSRSGNWVSNTNESSTSLKQEITLIFTIPQSILAKIMKIFMGGKKDRRDESARSASLFHHDQDKETSGKTGRSVEPQSNREINNAEPLTIMQGHRRICVFLAFGLVFCGIHVAG